MDPCTCSRAIHTTHLSDGRGYTLSNRWKEKPNWRRKLLVDDNMVEDIFFSGMFTMESYFTGPIWLTFHPVTINRVARQFSNYARIHHYSIFPHLKIQMSGIG